MNHGIIRQAWDRLLTGNYRLNEVTEWMVKHGIKGQRNNKPITKQTSAKLFRNKFYSGIVHQNTWNIVVKGKHEAMITEAEFYKAQEILDNYSNRENRVSLNNFSKNQTFPLNRCLRCSNCSRVMTGSYSRGKSGKRYGYYSCTNSKCKDKDRIKKEAAEETFLSFLEKVCPSPELSELFRRVVIDIYETKLGQEIEIRKPIQDKLKALEEQRVRLEQLVEQGAYTIEKYKERVNEIDIETATLQASFSDTNITVSEMETCVNRSMKFLEHLPTTWIKLSGKEKLKLHEILLPKGIYIENSEVRTPQIATIFTDLVKLSKGEELSLVNQYGSNGTRTRNLSRDRRML